MTHSLRARVAREIDDDGPHWFAYVYGRDRATVDLLGALPNRNTPSMAYAESQPEALAAAHKMLADLDRELMVEVHESRSSRWDARVKQIADEAFGEQALAAAPPLIVPIIPLTPTAARIFGRAVSVETRFAGLGDVTTPCPTCTGMIRETVNMVCPTCGTDYAPNLPEYDPDAAWDFGDTMPTEWKRQIQARFEATQ